MTSLYCKKSWRRCSNFSMDILLVLWGVLLKQLCKSFTSID